MYFERFLESLTECEIICNEEALKLQSIHPYEIISNKDNIINEAILTKESINNAKQKAIMVFIELSNKFKDVALKLNKRNSKWFESIQKFDLNNKDLSKFEYEMYDYRRGIHNLVDLQIPVFDEKSIPDLLGDGSAFKGRAFGEIFTKDSENNEDFNKAFFRGSADKILIKGNDAKGLFTFAFNWIKNYETAVVRPISVENAKINNIVNQYMKNVKTIVTESTILSESIFKDEYYDILLEEGIEPTDIKREEKESENTINTNVEENKENKSNNDILTAVQHYFKICSTIQTMKMNIAEEAYKAFTDFIDRVINN